MSRFVCWILCLLLLPSASIAAFGQQEAPVPTISTPHSGSVKQVMFSPDGHWLASVGEDKTVKVWDFASGRLLRTLAGHSDSIEQLAITSDGKRIVTLSGDKTTRIWDAETGAQLFEMKPPDGIGTNSFAITREGALISNDVGNYYRWDVRAGRLVGKIRAVNTSLPIG